MNLSFGIFLFVDWNSQWLTTALSVLLNKILMMVDLALKYLSEFLSNFAPFFSSSP